MSSNPDQPPVSSNTDQPLMSSNPDQPPVSSNTDQPPMSSNPDQPRSFKRCLIITVLLTATAFGIIIGAIHLLGRFVFHDPPSFRVMNFHIVNSFTNVVVDLAITNYNSNTCVRYGSTSALLSYGGDQVTTATVAPFDQEKDATTEVEARFNMPSRNSECGFDKPFGVKFSTIARYANIRKVKALTVSCDDIWVGCQNATTASMMVMNKFCTVHEV